MRTITFLAPKTAGNTTIATNIALLDQQQHPDLRIGLLQWSAIPDIHQHLGLPRAHHFGDLVAFYEDQEWPSDILQSITQHQTIEVLPSPSLAQWQSLSFPFFEAFWDRLSAQYDRLYLDWHLSSPCHTYKWIQEKTDQLILVGTADPCSLAAIETWQQSSWSFSSSMLCLNQLPRGPHPILCKRLRRYSLPLLPFLPYDPKAVAHQVLKGHPVAFQRRGRLKKTLSKMLSHIHRTA